MKKYRNLVESLPSKTIVLALGEFNPPTLIHELMVKTIKKLAESNKADYSIGICSSKKDILSEEKKSHYLNILYPNTRFVSVQDLSETVESLQRKYKKTILAVEETRLQHYKSLLENYNVEFISFGKKDYDSLSNKMKSLASKGEYSLFKENLNSSIRDIDAKLLMNDIRDHLGLEPIKEQIKFKVDSIREQYFQGNLFKEGDIVESNGTQYTIIKRGSNHILVEDSNGNKVSKWIKDVTLVEDVPQGYLPKEISYMGYTTKNLHHSKDAIGAFLNTIERHGNHPDNKHQILSALKATDAYMKLNDMHLEQQKAPDEKELEQWRKAHTEARNALNSVGEFMHHEDYWHNHEHELQDMTANYTPTGAGEPMMEDLTNKTIKPNDKIKVARMIADFLGYEAAEKGSNPDVLVNSALRKVKSKLVHSDSINILAKMLKLADDVGINYDKNTLPTKLKEACGCQHEPRVVQIDKKSKRNAAGDILSYKDFKKSLEMNKGIKEEIDTDNLDDPEELQVMDVDGKLFNIKKWDHRRVGHSLGNTDNDQLRRMKVKYKTEEVDHLLDEEDEIEFTKKEKKTKKPDAKVDNDEHQVGANNSKGFDAFFREEDESDEELEMDFSEDELEKMADDIDDDDVLDAYDDDELAIVDDETGEEIESDLKEETLNEVLSRQERIKAKIRFARTKAKRERKVKIALKKHSDTKTINKRARKLAIATLKKRLAKKPLDKLTVGEKERIERIVQKRKQLIDRLAMRMAPKVRKIETDRLAHKKYTKD